MNFFLLFDLFRRRSNWSLIWSLFRWRLLLILFLTVNLRKAVVDVIPTALTKLEAKLAQGHVAGSLEGLLLLGPESGVKGHCLRLRVVLGLNEESRLTVGEIELQLNVPPAVVLDVVFIRVDAFVFLWGRKNGRKSKRIFWFV